MPASVASTAAAASNQVGNLEVVGIGCCCHNASDKAGDDADDFGWHQITCSEQENISLYTVNSACVGLNCIYMIMIFYDVHPP